MIKYPSAQIYVDNKCECFSEFPLITLLFSKVFTDYK